MIKKSSPLNWMAPIVDKDGRPTPEFIRHLQQLAGNDATLNKDVVDLTSVTDAAAAEALKARSRAGPDGQDGLDGQDGISIPGPRGLTGATGLMGFGLDGQDGQDGMPIPGAPGTNGTNGANGFHTLDIDYTDGGNVTTAETDVFTYTIAAGKLATNGDRIESQWAGVFVSSGTATRQLRAYFGGTLIFDTGALTVSLAAAWDVYCTITRVSSTVIRYAVSMTTEGAALAAYTAVGEVTGLTLSNTNIIKLTGTAAGVGAATNDIVGKMGNVSFYPL